MRIALFITCLTDIYYPRAGVAMVKVFEHLGHEVVFPEGQTCCGQPMHNSGEHDHARRLAERMVRIFAPFEHIVTPSGSCAAMVRRHFPGLLADDPSLVAIANAVAGRTHEFVEFLTDVLRVDLGALHASWTGPAALHASCHGREIGLDGGENLLLGVGDLDLRHTANAEQCCGFGGLFSIKYPIIAGQLAADKADALAGCGARTLICGDAGCAMNIEGACRRRHVPVRVVSPAEIIAESLGLLPREEPA